jgi:MoxR-like ATPase
MQKIKAFEDVQNVIEKIKIELAKVIIGQEEIIEHVLVGLLAGGHILIEGVPGLGKTIMANAISKVISSDFKRIQFTPDLMPADIIGTTVYNAETGTFQVRKGPVFTNILLADEINRSPAKTQSALLQAMQEKQVTIDGRDFPLEDFFICLATQNPIEMEGTYPLPEAQVDRFIMKVLIYYPTQEEEKQILVRYKEGFDAEDLQTAKLSSVIKKDQISDIKQVINNVIVDEKIIDYITAIIKTTRDYPGIEIGSSPRGSIALFKTSKIKAVLNGRDFVNPDDVKELVLPALRHRIILRAESEIEGYNADFYLNKLMEEIEVPR